MHRVLARGATVVGVALVASPGVGAGKSVAQQVRSMVVRAPVGASVTRVGVSEPAGVIRLFRVVAPAGARVRVTGVIPGLAGVGVSLPRAPHDNAETCGRHGRALVCSEAEEACPMPAATWHFRVRKLSGPAGRIRIDFVVGSQHSA